MQNWRRLAPAVAWQAASARSSAVGLSGPMAQPTPGVPALGSKAVAKHSRVKVATITAAVVGVILNLAIWFALHVLFAELRPMQWLGMRVDVPTLSSINLPSLVLTLGALIAVFRFKVGMIKVLLACSALGIVYYLATGATS